MKSFVSLIIILLALASGLQSGMKYKEVYTVETGLQPGMPVFDTGQGWLFGSVSKDKFPYRICKIEESGKITWFKGFAFKPVTMATRSGETIMLDEHGNFYKMDSSGSIITNLTEVVSPGTNILTFGSGETVYASSDDNSITCFQTDGNIEWMAMGKSRATSMIFIDNDLLVSEEGGSIVRYSNEGAEKWRLPVDGFASCNPIYLDDKLIWGLRNYDASHGKVISTTLDGKKAWETDVKKGIDYIFFSKDKLLVIGPLFSVCLDKNGKVIWEQPFDGSRKLCPMGFNDDDRLVLGILNPDGEDESLKITLLHPEGSITVVGKIPVKKNSLIGVSRRGRLIMLGLKDKIVIYKLLTMKEFYEGP